jgi:hypothetical protein
MPLPAHALVMQIHLQQWQARPSTGVVHAVEQSSERAVKGAPCVASSLHSLLHTQALSHGHAICRATHAPYSRVLPKVTSFTPQERNRGLLG